MSNRPLIVVFILCIWFIISFVTNIIAPLMPIIIEDFGLSLGMAGFLPFSFFLAYGIVSIPAGIMVEKAGTKTMLTVAFVFNLLGSVTFGLMPHYFAVICALFVIGMGMAMLQVVINPLMRTAGGEQHFAFFSVMGQLVFGLASFLSPLVFAALIQRIESGAELIVPVRILVGMSPEDLPWVSFYWGFAAIFVLVILVTRLLRIPNIELRDDERAGTWDVYASLLRQPKVVLFGLGIVAYVGAEQVLANWMSQFLHTYHDVSPVAEGAQAVSWFWGLMSVGCIVGLVLLKLLDSKVVLRAFSVLALLSVAAALFGGRDLALWAFPASGFFISVMFSIIFSLALNSVPRHHGAFSGILCSGILGGAIMPLIVGVLGDAIGLRAAMSIVFGLLIFIFSIGIWARPLVENQTINIVRRRKQRGEPVSPV